jgi:hypothetical protein
VVAEYLLHEVWGETVRVWMHWQSKTFMWCSLLTSVYAWHIDSYRFWCWWIAVSRIIISLGILIFSQACFQFDTFSTYWNTIKNRFVTYWGSTSLSAVKSLWNITAWKKCSVFGYILYDYKRSYLCNTLHKCS